MHEGIVESPELYECQFQPPHWAKKSKFLRTTGYLALGDTYEERANEYSKLFRYEFDRGLLTYIAETIKLGQVLGGDQFTEKIEKIANHRVRPYVAARRRSQNPPPLNRRIRPVA